MLQVSNAKVFSFAKPTSAANVSARISGVSPVTSNVTPWSLIGARPTAAACPVPFCGLCNVHAKSARSANAAFTCSAPCPTTTTVCAGFNAATLANECASSGRPASGCSTFGNMDFMRVPLPAARTMTESSGGISALCFGKVTVCRDSTDARAAWPFYNTWTKIAKVE